MSVVLILGVVYHNSKDMPLPSIGYPDRHDGRVYIIIIDENGRKRRKTIGHMTCSTPGQERMVPNDYFKNVYHDLWAESYPNDKVPAHEMSIGMYALTLGISEKSGLYSMLQDVYGMEYVNSILDYAMYSLSNRSSTTQIFEQCMEKEVPVTHGILCFFQKR